MMTMRICIGLIIPSIIAFNSNAFTLTSLPSSTTNNNNKSKLFLTRNDFIKSITLSSIGLILTQNPLISYADESLVTTKLTNDEIKDIVKSDIINNQFLATGQITRSIYKPTATFTDEIDTYELEQWIKGTQKLFVGNKSLVKLVGDIQVTNNDIQFNFDEDLMFNIPFRPVVSITGKVILERDPLSGLITSYREYWDQDVLTVLKSAKF